MSKATKIMNQRNEYKNEMINELNELGYNVSVLDELIPTNTKEERPSIIINKGKIIEVQTIIDNTDYALIEKLNNKIKELEDEIAALKQPVKGDDNKTNSKLELLKKIKKPQSFTLESALEEQKAKLAKEAEEKQITINNLPEHTLEYEVIDYLGIRESVRTHFGIKGTIGLNNKEYAFEATNNHHMPILYGCFDMDTIKSAKEIITHKVDKMNFMNDIENNAANYSHIDDASMPLVVWRLTDDNGNIVYHAYTDKYILVWDNNNFKSPARKLIKNIFENEKVTGRALWKKIENKKLSDKFIAVCKELYSDDFLNNQPITYQGPIDDFTPIANDCNDNLGDDIDL